MESTWGSISVNHYFPFEHLQLSRALLSHWNLTLYEGTNNFKDLSIAILPFEEFSGYSDWFKSFVLTQSVWHPAYPESQHREVPDPVWVFLLHHSDILHGRLRWHFSGHLARTAVHGPHDLYRLCFHSKTGLCCIYLTYGLKFYTNMEKYSYNCLEICVGTFIWFHPR